MTAAVTTSPRWLHFWSDRPLAVKGLIVIALPLAALLGALLSLYAASTAEIRAEDDVRRAFAIQRDTSQVHALLAEAAAGVRGYALTSERRFLRPYEQAEAALPATMKRLRGQIRDPEVAFYFRRIEAAVGRKREGLANIVRLADEGARPPGSDRLERALFANKVVLDGMRADIDAIQRREAVLLAERQDRVEDVRQRYLALTLISGLAGLLGSLLAVYLFSTGIVRRVQVLELDAERLAGGEPIAMDERDDADELGALRTRLVRTGGLLFARQEALKESEERFRLVVEEVRDYGIFALDPEGRVASWNRGAERIKGWRAEEIMGQHFSRFYPPETRDSLPADMLARARAQGSAEDEGWRLRKDGSRFWANVVVTALRDEGGRLKGFAKITRDITERREAEQALGRAREQAEAANFAKSEFLSRTSHELRTPMGAILGFGQLLELDLDQLQPQHQASVSQIMIAGRHLLSLIEDLLDISSIEAGGSDLVLEEVAIGEVAQEVRRLIAPLVEGSGLTLIIEASTEQATAWADRRRVVQVLLNLLANAAKYHESGSRIRLGCKLGGEVVRIEVEDDGRGIAPRDVPRLFTPFDRLDQQKNGRIAGTGLGLALSRQLIQSMGGEIGYEPATPGALFWFTLPAANSSKAG